MKYALRLLALLAFAAFAAQLVPAQGKTSKRAEREIRLGNFAEAEKIYRQLIEHDQANNNARLGLSFVLIKQIRLQSAYEEAARGCFSRRPYLDIVIPSLTDPSIAPPGKHVMSCFVQYAPYHLAESNWDDQREAFGDTVVNTIAEYAPNFKSIVRHRQVVTPLDLEREWGLSEGNIFQGELSLEQLFFLRPVAGWANYRTPIDGLVMCGSATHPGGGIMGAPGRNAALAVLKGGKA